MSLKISIDYICQERLSNTAIKIVAGPTDPWDHELGIGLLFSFQIQNDTIWSNGLCRLLFFLFYRLNSSSIVAWKGFNRCGL